MYVVLLKFAENKSKAPEFMAEHKEWIKKGIDDNLIFLVGSLTPNLGGTVFFGNLPRENVDEYVSKDPFVQQNIVKTEIIEIAVNKTIKELEFLQS